MSPVPQRIKDALAQRSVPYEMIRHRRDYTAQETAQDTRTPGIEFAKTVVLRVDGAFVMAVLPAPHKVDLDELRRALRARDIRLATEDEIERLCPDCEVGAEPPLGMLYELPVYVSSWLTGDERITFNAGTHEDAIRMRFSDFLELVRPTVLDFSSQH